MPDIGYQRALNPEPIAAVEPTVVLGAEPADRVWQEEVFGPVLALERVATTGEAFARVNAGVTPPAELFAPESAGRILAAAQARQAG